MVDKKLLGSRGGGGIVMVMVIMVVVVSRNRNSRAPTYTAQHAFIGRIWKDATVPLLGVV